MFCYKCGTENQDDSVYCYKCGCKIQFDTQDGIMHQQINNPETEWVDDGKYQQPNQVQSNNSKVLYIASVVFVTGVILLGAIGGYFLWKTFFDSTDLHQYLGTSATAFYKETGISDDVVKTMDQGIYIDCCGTNQDIITTIMLSEDNGYNLFGISAGMKKSKIKKHIPAQFHYDKALSSYRQNTAIYCTKYEAIAMETDENNQVSCIIYFDIASNSIGDSSFLEQPDMFDSSEDATTPEPTESTIDDYSTDDYDSDEADSGYEDEYDYTDSGYEDDYILPNSEVELIKKSDIKGLSKTELRLARNEIYARHGRLFVDQELQSYFDDMEWYIGYIEPEDFVDSEELSKIERKNIAFIQRYE